ncbi:MAG: LysR family transcriptional regulator [Lachnospiraceae bacterium]|nr:LysR family transcriptional regulator [Lachnospiraceae bacterium]
MNIRQMKYCLEIHRAGSLQKAAQNLNLSQPALTQQLQRIEKELKVRIFNRDARPIAPTREGEYCIKSFEKIVYEYERMNHTLNDMRSLAKTEITIGIPPVRAQQFLPLIIPAFRAAYPQIRINYREIVSRELPEALKSGSIDLAVMILEQYAEGFEFVPLCTDRSVLVAKRLSPYAAIS